MLLALQHAEASLFIILVQWFIKPAPQTIEAFQQFWATQVPVNDRTHLIGEFLSNIVPGQQLPYPVHLLAPDVEVEHVTFVNVGIWRDERAFETAIGQYIPTNGSLLDFEAAPRKRYA